MTCGCSQRKKNRGGSFFSNWEEKNPFSMESIPMPPSSRYVEETFEESTTPAPSTSTSLLEKAQEKLNIDQDKISSVSSKLGIDQSNVGNKVQEWKEKLSQANIHPSDFKSKLQEALQKKQQQSTTTSESFSHPSSLFSSPSCIPQTSCPHCSSIQKAFDNRTVLDQKMDMFYQNHVLTNSKIDTNLLTLQFEY